jgi:methionyl-tRNA formyltransferase
MRPTPSPVKKLALSRNLPVEQPQTLRSPGAEARLKAVGADAMVVAAYGLILPPPILRCAKHGAINIHGSLLPRWRGAAPIQRAILAGDAETGVSIMQMDEGLDTGPVLSRRSIPIGLNDDFGSVHDKVAELGASLLLEVLASVQDGSVRSTPQPDAGATYAAKIDKSETWLDWKKSATELERAVRAFRPAPGALARFQGQPMKIWRVRVERGAGAPGAIIDAKKLQVACGSSALAIEELQPAGGRRMAAKDFLRGHRVESGMRFE